MNGGVRQMMALKTGQTILIALIKASFTVSMAVCIKQDGLPHSRWHFLS